MSSYRLGVLSVVLMASGVAQAATHQVTLSGFVFTPANITIVKGDTVHWEWVSGNHNVESGVIVGGAGVGDGNFRSGDPTPVAGTTFEITFDQAFLAGAPIPGHVYPYFCIVHAGLDMAGTITVIDPVPTVSAWGLGILFVTLLIAGSVLVIRRRRFAEAG